MLDESADDGELMFDEDVQPEPFGGEEYWASTKDEAAMRSYIDDRMQAYYDFCERRGFVRLWRRVFCQVHGLDEDSIEAGSNEIMFRGDDGELLDLRINDFRSFERQMLSMIAGHRPSFQTQSTNTDYASSAQADIGQGVLDYYWTHNRMEAKYHSVVEATMRYCTAYSWLWWDADAGPEVDEPVELPPDMPLPEGVELPTKKVRAGQLKYRRKYPWEVIIDPFVDDEDDHEWKAVLHRQNRWNLAARYPEMAEDLLAGDTCSSGDKWSVTMGSQDVSEDEISVVYFYHARTPAMPEGRLFVYAGKAVIYDGPLPDDDIPVIGLSFSKFEGTALGYAEEWDWLPIQTMIGSVVSAAATNVDTFGQQLIAGTKGTELNIEMLANGYRYFELPINASPPVAVTLAQIPDAAKWLLDYLHTRLESITGLNSVARGQPDANIKSGTMAALFHAIAVEFNSFAQQQSDHHIGRVMTLVLNMLKRHAKRPQLALIAGVGDQHKVQMFTGDDLSSYERVTVVSANPMLRQTAGKMEIARAMMEIPGAVRTPEQIVQLYTTGQLKPVTRASSAQLELIQHENELLAKGTRVEMVPAQLPPGTVLPPGMQPPMEQRTPDVPVLITDDPMHVAEHLAIACRPDVRTNPEIIAGVLAHVDWHLRELKKADPFMAAIMKFNLPMGPEPMPGGGGGAPPSTPEALEPPDPGAGLSDVDLPSPAESPNH